MPEVTPRDQAEALLALAADEDKNVRNRVARELGKLGDPGARAAIAAATRSSEWRRQFAAVRAMRLWEDDERLPAAELQALLASRHDSLRWAAVRVLRERDRLAHLGPIAAADPVATVRWAALVSLAATPPAEALALEGLKDEDRRVRAAAVYFFRLNPNPDVLPALALALADRFMWNRIGAVWSVAKVGGRAAAEAILPLLRDRKRPVRWAAAGALGRLGDERALEPLLGLLERSTKARSGIAAISALGDLHDPRAVAPVIRALRDTAGEGADDTNTRRAAATALLALGGEEAEAELARLPESFLAPLREALARREGMWRRYEGGL